MDQSGLLIAARRAVDAAQERPADAMRNARALLSGDAGSEVVATVHWAVGLAQRELNRLADADASLALAVRLADEGGHRAVAAGARTSRALALVYLGRTEAGLAELDRAERASTGIEQARAQMQRGLILQRLGRLPAALDAYAAALPGLVTANDRIWEVRLRINRGIALAYLGQLGEADAELRRARTLALELGQTLQVAMCSHNLGFVHGRRGDVPVSLGWFDATAREYDALDVESGLAAVLCVDRAQVLLDAALAQEALELAERAIRLLAPTGNGVELAEAELLAARAALAVRRTDLAASRAAASAGHFRDQQRESWALLADFIELVSGGSDRGVTCARDLADALDAAGWSLEALSARELAGRMCLDVGDRCAGLAELDAAARGRSHGTAAGRVAAWHARAQRCVAIGDRRGARRAVRSGLAVLEGHRATLAAADLRAHAAGHGAGLAGIGVALALEAGRPEGVLAAAEAWRAGSVVAPVVPPRDPVLADLLDRLRSVSARRREEPGGALAAELALAEGRVRDHTRARAVEGGPRAPVAALDREHLVHALGERVLVEWVRHGDVLHAVTVGDGRVRTTQVGPLPAALDAVASVRMCLHRLARGRGSPRSLAAARATLQVAAPEVEAALLGALAGPLAERELVLVPTGALHTVPWLALPAVRRGPSVVAASARAWLAVEDRPRRPGLLLAAGPDLPGAAAEVAALAQAFPGATVLAPADATVAAVLEGLGGVGVAHVAAHGRFRTDNPQFSSLRLADGELTVYDLDVLRRAPDVLVLSACDAAVADVRPGDELLGLSSALLALGTGALVAPVVPVPDDATVPLMRALQAHLAAGLPARAALSRAVVEQDDSSVGDAEAAAALSFVALGR